MLLANKDLAAAKTRVRIQSDKAYHSARVFRFHGQGPDDMRPIWEELAPVPVRGNTVSDLDLPGVSLTVLSLP